MSDFFARPWLLLAAPLIYWVLKEHLFFSKESSWADFLPPNLASRLLTNSQVEFKQLPLIKLAWLVGCLTFLFTLALAGVGYSLKADQLPGEQQELVIIQYLSPPIRGNPAPFSQLEASQRALIPLLNSRNQGKTALVFYAGSAHLVSPMTDDTATLRQLFSLSHPSVMPLGGHKPEAAFRLASSLGKLATSNKQGHLDWLWLTDQLPSPADLQQLIQLKPKRAKLYLVALAANQTELEQLQASFTALSVTLLLPTQVNDYAKEINRPLGGLNKANRLDIELFKELSHWPLLVALLLLAWQFFDQPRIKMPFKFLWVWLVVALGLTQVQPLQAAGWQNLDYQAWQALQKGEVRKAQQLAKRADLKAQAEFLLGNYVRAARLFIEWQTENDLANDKEQAELLFNTATAWLLAEQPALAQAAFNQAKALQPDLVWPELCINSKLADIQLAKQKAPAEQELLTLCSASQAGSSAPKKEETGQEDEPDWEPEEAPSCLDCQGLDAMQEKQLQQLQEDPWRLLRLRFQSELKEQQP